MFQSTVASAAIVGSAAYLAGYAHTAATDRPPMLQVALIGASGHASDVLSLIESLNRDAPAEHYSHCRVVGLFHSDPASMDSRRFEDRDVEVLALDTLVGLAAEMTGLRYIACVGYPSDRQDVAQSAAVVGLEPLTVVHRTAAIGTNVTLGTGVVILAQTSISPVASIGDHSYISHGALVGHDTIIGAYSSLMPGCSVSGDCIVGPGSTIGSNATVLEKIEIGAGATVGAGAVVTRNVAAGDTVVGAPAKVVSSRR